MHMSHMQGKGFMSYQKVTGPLMANSHPGSYCGQDAYSDMLVTECKECGVSETGRKINGSYKKGRGVELYA